MTESDFKRALIKRLQSEGGFGRRMEDRYAVGLLDLLLATNRCTIYGEAKILNAVATLPATVRQAEEIRQFNLACNQFSAAFVIGYRPKERRIGFGLPGTRWDAHATCGWPVMGEGTPLSNFLDLACGWIIGSRDREQLDSRAGSV